MAQPQTQRDIAQTDVKEPSTVSSHSHSVELKHHEEFWFHDGNIVLITGDTGYRVYQGLLSSQSTVFQDMFSSSIARHDELYEGFPIVRLSDSPQDLAHFLRVLLPKSQRHLYRLQDGSPFSFDQIFAITRLAHKYGVEDLQKQALYILQEYHFTNDFDRFDDPSRFAVDHVVQVRNIQAIGVVNLARLTDTPTMLPIALYRCCGLGGKLLDGWRREDGEVEHLSTDDIKRCLDAREKLAQEAFTLIDHVFSLSRAEKCRSHYSCILKRYTILRRAVRSKSVGSWAVLDSWKDFIQTEVEKSKVSEEDPGLCPACAKELVKRDLEERRTLWNRLPDIFGIVVQGWATQDG
ncbi:hypothetical protein L227DRAFT_556949 [Lentinus tigrinus ALCF2SS1-6]|uniref:BTB domain-containing protein n=1 Tax=Lentinus tigrinus ALCF2SS1-6 TaxID=1328759 RepID=A0A5C2RR26_9APHY|nr:hypothetical protein L227DRAFT_556949 [Lentinus tigrinus ALCF2SS1-6]